MKIHLKFFVNNHYLISILSSKFKFYLQLQSLILVALTFNLNNDLKNFLLEVFNVLNFFQRPQNLKELVGPMIQTRFSKTQVSIESFAFRNECSVVKIDE